MKIHFAVFLALFCVFLQYGEAARSNRKTCLEVLKYNHGAQSGLYEIDPDGQGPFKVYCDMETDGGGWTVFQRRQDGSQNFFRNWADYKNGFGDCGKKEFYLGNDRIHRITAATPHRLRIDLEDFECNTRRAEYRTFSIGNEGAKYKLSVSGYSGNAGDSFSYHNGRKFSTKDQDNDAYGGGNCAVLYKGAWWYNKCHKSNLNGRYLRGRHASYANGVNWYTWRKYHYSLKVTEMKIRPLNY